jgi:hypothetical protein
MCKLLCRAKWSTVLSLSFYFFFSLLSLSPSLSISISISLFPSLYLCLCLSLYLSLILFSLSLSLSLSLFLTLSLFLFSLWFFSRLHRNSLRCCCSVRSLCAMPQPNFGRICRNSFWNARESSTVRKLTADHLALNNLYMNKRKKKTIAYQLFLQMHI